VHRTKAFSFMFVAIILDRVLKFVMMKGLVKTTSFFGSYPHLLFFENHGIAFSIPVPAIFTMVISVVVVAALFVWMFRSWKKKTSEAATLIILLGGALSNLYDRIVFGFVVDVIEVFPGSIWNIADILILVGLLFLVFYNTREPKNKS